MSFCDFCPCEDCQTGHSLISTAPTAEGKNICDVCWLYDECVRAKRASGEDGGPCEGKSCSHRPTIVGDWVKGTHNKYGK